LIKKEKNYFESIKFLETEEKRLENQPFPDF